MDDHCLSEYFSGYDEEDRITEAEPILMLPLPAQYSKWVIKNVAEVKRRLGYAFRGLEECVEEFFREIEKRRSWSPRKVSSMSNRQKGGQKGGRKPREVRNLWSGINYDREERGRSKRKGRRAYLSHDEGDTLYLEC